MSPGWDAYLGTSRHDGAARESLPARPRTVWQQDAGRAVPGSPALAGGVVAVGTSDRAIVLLDRATGQRLWRRGVPGPVAAGPLLDGELLFVATEAVPAGRVLALRIRTGRTVWKANSGGVTAPLALAGGVVIAATDAGTVLALDRASGRERWRERLRAGVRAAPVPTPAGIVVATMADTLYLLDRDRGTVTSRLATPGTVVGTPATDGQAVYLATTAGQVLAVSLPGLSIAWQRSVDEPVYGAPALVGDTLYVVNAGGTLWHLPVATPSLARAVPLQLAVSAGPTPLADGVLVATVSGEVICVGPSDRVRWRLQRRGPMTEPPLVQDGQLVLVAGDGTVEVLQ